MSIRSGGDVYVDPELQARAAQLFFVSFTLAIAIVATAFCALLIAKTLYFKSKYFRSHINKLVRVLAAANLEDKKVTITEEKKLFFTQYYVRVPFEHAGYVEYLIPFLGLSIARELVAHVEEEQDKRLARKVPPQDISSYLNRLPRRRTDGHEFN